jgi:predicted GIY-YIG superfamily endonuclease
MSSNLHKRVFQHKFHLLEGFTARYEINRLLYYESYDDVRKAIDREKQLKGWRREKKIMLFEQVNPHWLDLAKDWYPETKTQFSGRGTSTPPEHSLRERPDSAQYDNEEYSVSTPASVKLSTKTQP